MKDFYRIGLDVGSTTAKVAVLDPDDKLVYSRYERHNAKVKELVGSYFREIARKFPNARVGLCVTGSVGMSTAEQLGAEFVQEVVAATVFARKRYPQAKALMEHLYSYFYQQIKAGNISLSPKEEACTFCDYRGICRFHGRYEKIKPIKEED